MSRNSSIGYIPPTPFRDDSDVFVLPAAQPEAPMQSVVASQQPAWTPAELAQELEALQALRTELRERHSEIKCRLQDLFNSQFAALAPAVADVIASAQRPAGSKQFMLPQKQGRGEESAAAVEAAVEGVSVAGLQEVDEDTDRLAALKAQLASRLRAMQLKGERAGQSLPSAGGSDNAGGAAE